jgi:hypothetical protein
MLVHHIQWQHLNLGKIKISLNLENGKMSTFKYLIGSQPQLIVSYMLVLTLYGKGIIGLAWTPYSNGHNIISS